MNKATATVISLPVDSRMERQHHRAMPLTFLTSPRRREIVSFDRSKLRQNGLVRFLRANQSSKPSTLDTSTSSSTTTASSDSASQSSNSLRASTGPSLRSCLKVGALEGPFLELDDDDDNSCVDSEAQSRSVPSLPFADAPKRVTWSTTTEVQYYTTILGDNPSVTRGAPLSLGKPVGPPEPGSLNDVESRPFHMTPVVSVVERERILMEAGYSRTELEAMEAKLLHIKLARKANAKQSLWDSPTMGKALKALQLAR